MHQEDHWIIGGSSISSQLTRRTSTICSPVCLSRMFLRLFRPSFLRANGPRIRNLCLSSLRQSKTDVHSLDVSKEFVRDTMIFKRDNLRELRMYQAFAALNFIAWNYFGINTIFRVAAYAEKHKKEYGLGERGYLQSFAEVGLKYSKQMAVFAACVGYGGLMLIGFFSARNVNTIIIRKGGLDAVILTSRFVAISKLREIRVPLKHITCKTSRDTTATYATFRIKGHPFFFLVDKKGVFYNPFLFDRTIGVQRNISKV